MDGKLMELAQLPSATPDEAAITMLEFWLTRVRSGENLVIAIAGKSLKGDFETSYYGGPHDVVGPVAFLLHRINTAIAE